MITLQNFPKIRAPEIFCQIYPVKVPPAGLYPGKVPVQECKTAHVVLLLPPIARSLLLGLIAPGDTNVGFGPTSLSTAYPKTTTARCSRSPCVSSSLLILGDMKQQAWYGEFGMGISARSRP